MTLIWRPFTQHQTADIPLAIVRGEGAYLIDAQGKRYLDLISSWWVTVHGHGHPEIAQAIYTQACQLEHVIFSGFTHEPAELLAKQLLALLPDAFTKIFYSDNGSTAVEVALKMAYQFWHNQGEGQRKGFIAFEKGYHGDTFGAMAVGKNSGFHHAFNDLLFDVEFFPYPATHLHDQDSTLREQMVLHQLSDYLNQYGQTIAAAIIEPLVQGAGGMRMCRPQFLQQLESLLRGHGVLIIYDEVMTGFGRTGDYFACKKSATVPDIICLAKGLTGGFLPLAVTACHERIYSAFLANDFKQALAHGHTYTANPLGCVAALASLRLLQLPATQAQIKMIAQLHAEILPTLKNVNNARHCGTIAAFDLPIKTKYGSAISVELRKIFANQGLIIRPLGEVIYLLPPYCVTQSELIHAYEIIMHEIQKMESYA